MRPTTRRSPDPQAPATALSAAAVPTTKARNIKLNISYVRYWLPVIAWAAVISYMSSLSGDNLPDMGIVGADKFAHFSEYLVLGMLLTRAIFGQAPKISLSRALLLSIIISVLYAAVDEWHQTLIPGRQADVLDFAADIAGIILGSMLYLRRWLGAKDKTF